MSVLVNKSQTTNDQQNPKTKQPSPGALTALGSPSNDAKDIIALTRPYVASFTIQGVCPIIFHRYSPESVKEKDDAPKGSEAKKTDDVLAYVYRVSQTDNRLGIGGDNMRAAIVEAGKSFSDPRSKRRSMVPLLRAGVMPLDIVAPLEPDVTNWDYDDARRVGVNRAAVTRVRPAMNTGWKVSFNLLVSTPEFVKPDMLHMLVSNAGKLVGLCDFRPTYGRFNIVRWEILDPTTM